MRRLTVLCAVVALAGSLPACKKKKPAPPKAVPQAQPTPTAPTSPTTPTPGAPTPRQILEQAVAAHGGATALRRKAGATTISSQGIYYGTPYKLKTYWKAPDKMVMEFPEMSMMMGYLGGDCWNRMYGLVVDCSPQEKPAMREMLHVSHWATLYPLLDKGVKLEAAPDRKVGGKPAVGVRVTSKDGKFSATFHFDKSTHLLVRMAYQGHWAGRKGPMVTRITGYKKQGGVVIPAQSTMSFAGKRVLSETVVSAELGEVEDGNLRRPPQARFGQPMKAKIFAHTAASVIHRGPWKTLGKSFRKLMGLVHKAKLTPMGPPMTVFLKSPKKKGEEPITEVRVSIAPPSRQVKVPGLTIKKIPTTNVAVSNEKGSYKESPARFNKLSAWVKAHGLRVAGKAMMVFMSNPKKEKPENLLSQIYLPVAPKP